MKLPSQREGTLRPDAKHVKQKNTQDPAAQGAQPLPVLAARQMSLLIYLAGQFEEIQMCSDFGEAMSRAEDLQSMISHHPDLRAHSDALRSMVEGHWLMLALCAEVANPQH